MNEHTIKIPCRISELLPEHQVVIIRLINHLASSGDKYKDNVIKRLNDITLENCLTFFDDKVMTKKEKKAWLNLIQPRSSTCLHNFLKEDMSPELNDMINKELKMREID